MTQAEKTPPRGSLLDHTEEIRYSRHILLDEIGIEGQRRLKEASALIVGSGGLGSPISIYLAAAGIGRIGLVDADKVVLSNLQRQVLYGSSSLERKKVHAASDRLHDLNPYVTIDVFDANFTPENALQISKGYDIILDGSDNLTTRYLMNDVCVLTGKPYVYGAVLRFEGQSSVFWAERGPCYRCLFPDPPPPGSLISPSESGLLGSVPGTIGTIQATEAVKILLQIGEPLIGRLLLYDALELRFEELSLKKNPKCQICSDSAAFSCLADAEAFYHALDHSSKQSQT